MCKICLYFDLDVPFILNKYRCFDIGKNKNYFDEQKTKELIEKFTRESYQPLNESILELIRKHKGKFKVTFSVSGFAFELFEKYSPKLIDSFKQLSKTGCIEFVLRPYHNLFAYSREEYSKGIEKQKKHFKKIFGVEPRVSCEPEIDDLAKKFQEKKNSDFYYNVQIFANEINSKYGMDDIFNMKFVYDYFKRNEEGKNEVFDFLEKMPEEVLKNEEHSFEFASDVSNYSDKFRDLYFKDLKFDSEIEKEVYEEMKNFETIVLNSGDEELIDSWRRLNNYSNFYHLKHHDNNPYESAYDAYVYFMNILSDMKSHSSSV